MRSRTAGAQGGHRFERTQRLVDWSDPAQQELDDHATAMMLEYLAADLHGRCDHGEDRVTAQGAGEFFFLGGGGKACKGSRIALWAGESGSGPRPPVRSERKQLTRSTPVAPDGERAMRGSLDVAIAWLHESYHRDTSPSVRREDVAGLGGGAGMGLTHGAFASLWRCGADLRAARARRQCAGPACAPIWRCAPELASAGRAQDAARLLRDRDVRAGGCERCF